MSTKQKNSQEGLLVYPVEIELTEKFLEKNPTIKSIYEEGKLQLALSSKIDQTFAKTITDVVGELHSRELVLFNPLLDAINNIAEFQNVVGTAKPERTAEMNDKDYEKVVKEWIKSEEEVVKKITGAIRSFNGSTTNSKKEIKEPIIAAGKKIDTLYNALKSFSEQVKQKVETNFKPLLDEKARIEEEKQRALKEVELAQIAELEQKSNEANEKLLEAQRKISYADLMAEITNYFSSQDQNTEQLNISGLQTLKDNVLQKSFDVSSIGPAEQIALESLIKTMRTSLVLKIDTLIANDSAKADVLEAEEFKENLEKYPQGDPTIAVTDSDQFVKMAYHLTNAKREITRINSSFKDPRLKELSEKLEAQFTGLSKNMDVLINFVNKKAEQFSNLK